MSVQLVPLAAIQPSTYNPRITDPARLELVKLSLRKLGFVLPVYADADGEILSGHQRHLAACELGWESVPVVRTKAFDLEWRKNINVVFNRGTNDMQRETTSASMTAALDRDAVIAMGEALPDKEGDARFPCQRAESIPLNILVEANSGRWNDYTRNLARTLARHGIQMPVVARRDFFVVNGIGRVQQLAESGATHIDVVFVSDAEADFAAAMLNYLSMDFNIHERYADTLRHNSFRRSRGDRTGKALGTGMIWPLGLTSNRAFDLTSDANFALFQRKYGQAILDFGAGRLEDVTLLRSRGFEADAFEPFTLTPGSDTINPDLARSLTREFLGHVAAGKQWDSIFLQAVLNSVPFDADRQHIITLLAALAGPFSTVYAYTSSRKKSNYRQVKGKDFAFGNAARSIGFRMEYEDGVVLGDYANKPKMQKYFTLTEFANLFRRHFRQVVTSKENSSIVMCAVRAPRGVDRDALRAAIEFEFDLPYPDGTRLGLAGEALSAFGQRLGVAL